MKEDDGLLRHAGAPGASPASSLICRQLKLNLPRGQLVPTKSTVLLPGGVPHVETASVPRSGVPPPRLSRNTMRRAGSVDVCDMPHVLIRYISSFPSALVVTNELVPLRPLREMTEGSRGPHTGDAEALAGVGDGDVVRDELDDADVVMDADDVRVCDGDGVPVCEPVCNGDGVPVCEPVCDGDGVPVCEPVCDGDGVHVCEPVCDGDGVPVCEPVCDGDGVPVCEPVCDGDGVADCEPVCDGDGVPVCEPVCDCEGVPVCEDDRVPDDELLGDCDGVPVCEDDRVPDDVVVGDCDGVPICEDDWLPDDVVVGDCDGVPVKEPV
jgi:hypothetical protein